MPDTTVDSVAMTVSAPIDHLSTYSAALATDVDGDGSGRVWVAPDLTIPGHSNVFVIGDTAGIHDQGGEPLPGVAPVAIQQGKYVARTIRNRFRNKSTPPFRYRDFGTMATIGRHRAVAVCGPFRFSGYLAWFAWLFVHVVNLIEFRDRVFVLLEWAWNYFTWNRGARLITGQNRMPADADQLAQRQDTDPSASNGITTS